MNYEGMSSIGHWFVKWLGSNFFNSVLELNQGQIYLKKVYAGNNEQILKKFIGWKWM